MGVLCMNLRQIRKRAIEAKKHYNAGNPNKQEYRVYFTHPNGFVEMATVGATSRNMAKKYAIDHKIKVAGGNKDAVKNTSIRADPAYRDYYPRPLNKPKNRHSEMLYANNNKPYFY